MKIQTHAMFLDTLYNSPSTVLSTIYENFVESAMKLYRYVKSMTPHKEPRESLLISEYLRMLGSFMQCIDGMKKKQ